MIYLIQLSYKDKGIWSLKTPIFYNKEYKYHRTVQYSIDNNVVVKSSSLKM